MQLPTVPNFTANDTSLTKLVQLSQCAQFVGVGSAVPMWRFYRAATMSLSANVITQIPFPKIALDTDGVWTSPGIATIVTQGYYSCEACLDYVGQSSTYTPQLLFQFTAGPNNPNFAAGTTVNFGGHSSAASSVTASDFAQCTSDKCPVVCYPADTIAVWCQTSVAATLNYETNATATTGWFVPTFSGRWVRMGP